MAANLGTLTAVLKADVSGLTKGFKKAQAETVALSKTLKGSRDALNRFTGGVNKGRDAMGRFRGAAKDGTQAIRGIGKASGSSLQPVLALAQGFIGLQAIQLVTRLFADAIKTNAQFEQSIKDVAIISNATAGEIELLSRTASELGATTQFTANQSAAAMINFARAGFNAAETAEAMSGTLALAAATGGDLSTASNIMVASIKSFGLETGATARLADIYTAAISNSRFSIESLNAALKVGAPAGAAFNQSVEDTTLVMGLFVDNVGEGEAAATALRATMAQLAKPTDEAAAVLAKYGLTVEDVNPENQKLSEILKKIGEAGIEGTDALILFTRRALGPAVSASKRLAAETTTLRQSLDDQGIAARNAAKRLDTLEGSMTLLSSKTEAFAKVIGKILTPAAQFATDALTGFFDAGTSVLTLDFKKLSEGLAGLEFKDLFGALTKGAGGVAELFATLNNNVKATAAAAAAGAGDVKELAGELRATAAAAEAAKSALGGDDVAGPSAVGTENLRASLRAAVEAGKIAKEERQRERKRISGGPRFGGERKFGESLESATALANERLMQQSVDAAKAAGVAAKARQAVADKAAKAAEKASAALLATQETARDRLGDITSRVFDLTATATEKAQAEFDKALDAWITMGIDARLTADEIDKGVVGLTKNFRNKIEKIQAKVDAELGKVGELLAGKLVGALGAVGDLINSAVAGFEAGGVKGAIAAVVTDLVIQTESFQKVVGALNEGVAALVKGLDKIISAFFGLLEKLSFPKLRAKGKKKGRAEAELNDEARRNTARLLDTIAQDAEPALRELAAATKTAASAMSFVPSGVKVALRRFQAVDVGEIDRDARAESRSALAGKIALTELGVGGIVTAPTRALIGESGPEAVIPLDRLNEITGGGGGGQVFFDFSNSVVGKEDELVRMIMAGLRQAGFVTVGSPVVAGGRFVGETI